VKHKTFGSFDQKELASGFTGEIHWWKNDASESRNLPVIKMLRVLVLLIPSCICWKTSL